MTGQKYQFDHQQLKRKPIYSRWWFWLIVGFVAVIAIAGVTGGNSTNNSLSKSDTATAGSSVSADAKATDDPNEDDGWRLGDFTLDNVQFGLSVDGRVTNEQDVERTGSFTLTFFQNDHVVATTNGFANQVEGSSTVTVQSFSTDKLASTANLIVAFQSISDEGACSSGWCWLGSG